MTAAAGGQGSLIQGNIIGLGADGSGQGNFGNGIGVIGSPLNTIGGAEPAARNIISGNTNSGVLLEGTGSFSNFVVGNLIGTDATGTNLHVNFFNGILISNAPNNTVGGTTSAERNQRGF